VKRIVQAKTVVQMVAAAPVEPVQMERHATSRVSAKRAHPSAAEKSVVTTVAAEAVGRAAALKSVKMVNALCQPTPAVESASRGAATEMNSTTAIMAK